MKIFLTIISWILQIFVAVVLFKAGGAKLSSSTESVKLFLEIGSTTQAMKIIGILELMTAVLIMIGRTAHYGALLSFAIMLGAGLAHGTKIGFEYNNDGGVHFIFFICVLLCSLIIMTIRRKKLPLIGHTYAKKK